MTIFTILGETAKQWRMQFELTQRYRPYPVPQRTTQCLDIGYKIWQHPAMKER